MVRNLVDRGEPLGSPSPLPFAVFSNYLFGYPMPFDATRSPFATGWRKNCVGAQLRRLQSRLDRGEIPAE
jgi:hypothetical protein